MLLITDTGYHPVSILCMSSEKLYPRKSDQKKKGKYCSLQMLDENHSPHIFSSVTPWGAQQGSWHTQIWPIWANGNQTSVSLLSLFCSYFGRPLISCRRSYSDDSPHPAALLLWCSAVFSDVNPYRLMSDYLKSDISRLVMTPFLFFLGKHFPQVLCLFTAPQYFTVQNFCFLYFFICWNIWVLCLID